MRPPDRCDNTWIITASGRQFWPLNPRVEDVCIEDIAHALACVNRFTGHTRFPYSVAQHCVIGSIFCEQPLEFLLHDASEAYLCDLARPVKRAVPEYKVFEERLEQVISQKYGLRYPWHPCVKLADNRMLATERRDLLPNGPRHWTSISGVDPYDVKIQQNDWHIVKAMYLDRFRQLTIRSNTAYEE